MNAMTTPEPTALLFTPRLSLGLALLLGLISCAEKRQPPRPKAAPEASSTTAPSTISASTLPSDDKVPESFLVAEVSKSFVRADGSPASEGSLSVLQALDLNEDGAPEVVLVPGPRFCGTGGCALPKIFQERDGAWRDLSALQSKIPQSNEVEAVALLPEVFGGYHSLKLTRPQREAWVLRFDGKMYQLMADTPATNRVSEEQAASLMLAGAYYDPARGISPIGLWDKQGANKGAKISAVITDPQKTQFVLEMGVIGSPDTWHQAFFPTDFAGAPANLTPGVYQVEYRVNDLIAATREFTVK
jgi:hypothetical protein